MQVSVLFLIEEHGAIDKSVLALYLDLADRGSLETADTELLRGTHPSRWNHHCHQILLILIITLILILILILISSPMQGVEQAGGALDQVWGVR